MIWHGMIYARGVTCPLREIPAVCRTLSKFLAYRVVDASRMPVTVLARHGAGSSLCRLVTVPFLLLPSWP